MSRLVQQLTDNFVVVATALIGCLMLALVFSTPIARASERELMTKFTVNHPFEVPGMTLQPNTRYTIRLYDSSSTRNVVQVLNADGTKLLTQFLAISDERSQPADNTTFTFIETEPGYPMPIKEWFYPGRKTGLEFVYAKKQALEIARHAKKPALAVGAPTPATAENGPKAELPPAEQAKPTPAPESVDLHKLAAVRVEAVSPLGVPVPNPPTAEELPQQQPKAPAIVENKEPEIQKPVAPPASPASANTQEIALREFTKTAGKLPLIALLGTVCFGAGLGMKAV